jgi:hypothetical protein
MRCSRHGPSLAQCLGALAGVGFARRLHFLRRELLCLGFFERTTDTTRPSLVSHNRGRMEWDVVLHCLSSCTLRGQTGHVQASTQVSGNRVYQELSRIGAGK